MKTEIETAGQVLNRKIAEAVRNQMQMTKVEFDAWLEKEAKAECDAWSEKKAKADALRGAALELLEVARDVAAKCSLCKGAGTFTQVRPGGANAILDCPICLKARSAIAKAEGKEGV
jgi:Na+-translocating ferredoxin:NAD+ oxidoreductase RNF subunit RnfB